MRNVGVSGSNKRPCRDCGEPFIPNIMRREGAIRCAICLQVETIISENWDDGFLKKLNEPPLDGPRYG
jgi:hypothetical protein